MEKDEDIEKKIKTYNKLMACTDTGNKEEELGLLTALEESYELLKITKNIEKTKKDDYTQNG